MGITFVISLVTLFGVIALGTAAKVTFNKNGNYVAELEATPISNNTDWIKNVKLPTTFERFSQYRSNITDRIYGGVETVPNEFPWMVNLEITMNNLDVYFCGGIILDWEYILTSADCVSPLQSVYSVAVVAGDHDLTRTESTEHRVSGRRITVPGNFNPNTFAYDVAVISLFTPLRLTSAVRRVALADPTFPGLANEYTTLCGWGATSVTGSIQNRLRKTEMLTISNAQCSSTYGNVNPILLNMICAKGISGSQSGCYGDAGGPLMCHNPSEGYFVCGLASFMVECRTSIYPNVFQRMSSFVDWIRSTGVSVLTAGYTTPTTTTTTSTTTSTTTTTPPTTTTLRWNSAGENLPITILITFLAILSCIGSSHQI